MTSCQSLRLLAVGCVAVCCLALVLFAGTVDADTGGTFTPLRPPAIPLAVRSPYVNSWLSGEAAGQLPGFWPRFYTNATTAWQGLVRVDGSTYAWMGPSPAKDSVLLATQKAFRYTSTQSIFTFDIAGLVTLTATFLSPVWPDDLERQSLQFSYLQVSAASADGQPHNVQVYTDVTGEWTGPDASAALQWAPGSTDGVRFHTFSLANPGVFVENRDMAQWGRWLLGTAADGTTTARTGFGASDTRNLFVGSGRLDDGQDGAFRAIQDDWPVFAFARDLGTVSGTGTAPADVVFVLGLVQQQTVQFQGASSDGPSALAGLWTARHGGADPDPGAAAAFAYHDWAWALTGMNALDARIQNDTATAGGEAYAALAALAVRQTFGGLTVVEGDAADPSAEADAYLFLKEISSDSDVQTVDVLFPAHPLLLYLNATLVRRLLAPLYAHQDPATGGSARYPNAWAMHDLGVFPNATGYPRGDDEAMPVEECGNMILLTLACAGGVGGGSHEALDTEYLAQHWPLLDRWTQFLLEDALVPAAQLSTDDFSGPLANQTNLALKGLLGVAAMARIAQALGGDSSGGNSPPAVTAVTGVDGKAATYRSWATDAVQTWLGLAADPAAAPLPHTALAYGHAHSYSLLYNLFADRQLGLGVVPDAVYAQQSAFYGSLLADGKASAWGLALDTRHTWAKLDWQVFAAAVAENDTRAALLTRLARFAGAGTTDVPLTDLYDAGTGSLPHDGPTFVARPVVGGVFALLAMGGYGG